jgi:L-histidine Nalpha-methyltransferase
MVSESLMPFAQDVMDGLTRSPQKTLPCSWLYDDLGSVLFEAITLLPEYGLTRADAALLRGAAQEIVEKAGVPERVIELGSGTGSKTRHILEAVTRLAPVTYVPVDVSAKALNDCAAALGGIDGVSVQPMQAQYLDGIAHARQRRDGRTLILFLGSTIGNFAPDSAVDFLRGVRLRVNSGDTLLVGADLLKPREKLLLAYDDPMGVTAAFNLNLLARINRELGGEFQLKSFAHEARFDERTSRIEMHLRSRVAQTVHIAAPHVMASFREGETIWTESSYKFRREEIRSIGEEAGWTTVRQWVDNDWGFAETLFRA